MERGRITSRTHYEHVVDMLVGGEQEGQLTTADADRLSRMIDAYERSRSS